MRVLAVTIGDVNAPSTFYRLVQFEGLLRDHGVSVERVPRADVTRARLPQVAAADVLFNQKCLFATPLSTRLLASASRVVFDFDDAIYTRPGKPFSWLTGHRVRRRLRLWLSHAAAVTTSSEYLAAYARRHSANVVVIPMALDLQRWCPLPRACAPDAPTVIGWAGSPGNLPNLLRLEPVLASVLERHPRARLAVLCGVRPEWSIPFDYEPFRPGEEQRFVQRLDIGLLPLTFEEYSCGKSPIKAIQYLACGVPVVGNVQGATAEICTPENSVAVASDAEWADALSRLVRNPQHARRLGEVGRCHVIAHHDLQRNGATLLETLRGESG